MESRNLGPSFAGLFLGASAHADDVRTITNSLQCLDQQVNLVQELASQNGLQLNTQKCEVIIASSTCMADTALCTIESNKIEAKHSVKCLGFSWWSWDMSAKVAVEEGVNNFKERLAEGS